MAVKFTPTQRNAMKRIESAIEAGQDYRYQKSEDRGIFREYLAALKDRDLYEDERLYPHDLPWRVLDAAMRLTDPDLRLETVKAIFATSHPPTVSVGQDLVISRALNCRAFNVLPFLHEKGFRLTQKEMKEKTMDIGLIIVQGEWPHLELIAPNILWSDGSELIRELVRIPPGDSVQQRGPMSAAVSAIFVLEAPEDFYKKVSEMVSQYAWSKRARGLRPIDIEDEDKICAMLLLIEKGWLDTNLALEEAKGGPHEAAFGRFMSLVQQRRLDQETSAVAKTRASPRL